MTRFLYEEHENTKGSFLALRLSDLSLILGFKCFKCSILVFDEFLSSMAFVSFHYTKGAI